MTKKDSKHIPQRSEDQTTMTISLPKTLKKKMIEISKKEHRSVSKQAVIALEEEAAKYGYKTDRENKIIKRGRDS